MSHSTTYDIIDEPKPHLLAKLVVNPTFILLAAIILPFVFSLTTYLRFGLPFGWVILNAFWMGSPARWKTVVIASIGYALTIALPYIAVFIILFFNLRDYLNITIPYIHIAIQALFFFTLYWLVFTQQSAYGIHEYLKSIRD